MDRYSARETELEEIREEALPFGSGLSDKDLSVVKQDHPPLYWTRCFLRSDSTT
jgi:hypothetical protein